MRKIIFKTTFTILLMLSTPVFAAEGLLSIAITESTSGEYDDDVNAAIRAGAQATSLSLYWDEADRKGTYAPDFDWPTIANSYYPSKNLGLILSLPVIDTVSDRRPKDLRRLKWDDPEVITRFESYASEVLSRLSDTKIVAISIGNEIDGHLTRDKDWQAFGRFREAAQQIVNRLRPGAPVGFTMTWQGMQGSNGEYARLLNAKTDAMFINYYPLDAGFHVLPPKEIASQLDVMIEMAGGKPVFLLETGYPSGGCGSSDAIQMAYFQELFAAWQTRKSQIPLVNLVWLHEITAAERKSYTKYYGVKNSCFADYLGTLALRHLDGTNKPAYEWLINR